MADFLPQPSFLSRLFCRAGVAGTGSSLCITCNLTPMMDIPENSNFMVVTLQAVDEEVLKYLINRSNVRTNFFIFCLILEGQGRVTINLKDFSLRKNDLLIIPPDATKDNIYISKNAFVKVIAYTSDFILPLSLPENFWEMAEYFSAKNIPIWSLQQKEIEKLAQLVDRMALQHENKENHPYAKEILSNYFMIFLLELAGLARIHSQPGNQRYSRKETLTIQFHGLAKKHFKEERSVQEYAARLFVTPRYLTETVKEVSGKTAGEVIDSFTVQEAKIQLINTTKSVSEIAEELRFSDQSSFGKFFKRHTGKSPKEYRAHA